MKVGVYVDEETWKEMKNLTFRKHGTLRELSREVSKIIEENLPRLALRQGFESLGIQLRPIYGEEVTRSRLKRKLSSSVEIVREMRARP
jgi:hypothetical protein